MFQLLVKLFNAISVFQGYFPGKKTNLEYFIGKLLLECNLMDKIFIVIGYIKKQQYSAVLC